jgi:tetratricopeptide (TPR) repeat protein
MKNKNSTDCWLVVIGYWLLIYYMPYSIFHLPSSTAATKSNRNFKSKFLQIALNIPEEEKDKKAKNELKRIIEQIRSINLELQKEVFEPVIVPVEVSTDEPNEVVLEDKDTKEQQIKEIEQCPPNGIIARQTVKIIKKLSQDPNNLKNPFELAETLYLSGYLKEAAIFYQEALKRKSPNDADSARDRAWILFQIGNCLRNDDRSAAIKIYGQLITEYPNSTWKEFAENRRTLLDWYLKEEPHKLINERKQ